MVSVSKLILEAVTRNKDISVIKYLLDQIPIEEFDVNITDDEKWTLLHWSAYNGNINQVEFFIGKGAKVNAIADDGTTPMHYAALKGNVETVKLLLQNGADFTITNNVNRTPLDIALLMMGNIEVVGILKAAKKLILSPDKVNTLDLGQLPLSEDQLIKSVSGTFKLVRIE